MRSSSSISRLLTTVAIMITVASIQTGAAHGDTGIPPTDAIPIPPPEVPTALAPDGPVPEGIGVLDAWAVTTGSPGVVVAVIDTGVNRHPDLRRVLPGWDFVGNDSDVTEDDGGCYTAAPSYRGTEVAGVIAGAGKNNQGARGVAPNVSILPIRAFDQCGTSSGRVGDAILWAAGFEVPRAPRNPYPAKIINVPSYSTGPCGLQAAIDQVTAAGVTVVAGGGYVYQINHVDQTDVWSPANCNGVVAVSGSDLDGERLASSTFGPEIDVTAPGSAMTTSKRQSAKPWRQKHFGTGYALLYGSQAAAAHVSGAIALAASVDPTITPAEISALIGSTARAFPAECAGCGVGLLDAGHVIDTLTPTAAVIRPAPGEQVVLGAKARFQIAGVAARRVFISLTQGSTTVPLGSMMVAAGLGEITIPSVGFSAGSAELTFTPDGVTGQMPISPSFGVTLDLVAPRIEFAGPYSSLATGIRRSLSWSTIGTTSATGSLVVITPGGQEVVLRKSVRLSKGSYAFTPSGSGTYTFEVRPDAGAGIAAESLAVPVSSLSATGAILVSDPTVGGRGAIMVSTDFVGIEVPVTVWAVYDDDKVVRLTNARLKVGSGSVPFVFPRRLAGKTITFRITTLLKDTSLTCLAGQWVNQVFSWEPCETRTFEIAPSTP